MSAGNTLLLISGIEHIILGGFFLTLGITWQSWPISITGFLLMGAGVLTTATRNLFYPQEAK